MSASFSFACSAPPVKTITDSDKDNSSPGPKWTHLNVASEWQPPQQKINPPESRPEKTSDGQVERKKSRSPLKSCSKWTHDKYEHGKNDISYTETIPWFVVECLKTSAPVIDKNHEDYCKASENINRFETSCLCVVIKNCSVI